MSKRLSNQGGRPRRRLRIPDFGFPIADPQIPVVDDQAPPQIPILDDQAPPLIANVDDQAPPQIPIIANVDDQTPPQIPILDDQAPPLIANVDDQAPPLIANVDDQAPPQIPILDESTEHFIRLPDTSSENKEEDEDANVDDEEDIRPNFSRQALNRVMTLQKQLDDLKGMKSAVSSEINNAKDELRNLETVVVSNWTEAIFVTRHLTDLGVTFLVPDSVPDSDEIKKALNALKADG